MGLRYPQPDNEDEFEQLCLRFYRKLWKNESLKLYGKRGEKQDGVDIFDPLCFMPVRAVQCKHHENTKTIPPAEIKEEVQKAEKSLLDIEQYVIATTAKKSRIAQDTVAKLNQRSDKKFTVDIHFWDDICQDASHMGRVVAELIIYGDNILAGAVEATRLSINTVGLGSTEGATAADAFGAIETLLNERKLELAQHELEKFAAREVTASDRPEDQYKLLRLRAKLALECGEYDLASQLFFAAYDASPELDQAKQNRVLAYSLVGDSKNAYALATQYIAEGLTSSVMLLRLVDSITSLEQLDEYSLLIEERARTDDDLNTALSHKYREFGEYDRAIDIANRALKIAPESPHAHFAAALSLHSTAVHGELVDRKDRLRIAVEHYDAAEGPARLQRWNNLVPEILVNRAAAKMLAGDSSGAAVDYRAAVATASQPNVYVERAMGFFLQERDFSTVWELLDSLARTTPEAQYLALVAEYYHGKDEERRTYLDSMKALAELDWDRAAECRFHCVQWALELKEYELAESCVPTSFREQYPFQARIMLAWIRLTSGDEEAAKQEATKALDESVRSASQQELRLLAHVLVKVQDDKAALGLLEQVATQGLLDDDTRLLISCAQRLDRHDLLLRICRELREAGVQDEQMLGLEVQLLSRYAPEEALRLAKELISKSAKPSYFVAAKNMLAARLNRLDELTLDPAMLPTPGDLSPKEAEMVLFPYVAKRMYDEALKFVYAQRRLYFENEHAHGRYIYVFHAYGDKTGLLAPPAVVELDSAVLLELERGELRWIIIEDMQPLASRGEFPSNSELAQRIVDRRVGDAVVLPGNVLQPEQATLREIQSKYVRAFQDSLQNFGKRFPGTTFLQQVNVGNGDDFDPEPIVTSLQMRGEHIDKCVELYRDNPCSLYLFAERVGLNEREAVQLLAQHPDGLVKCSNGSPEEFGRAVEERSACDTIVLSISAIIALSFIDGWKHLDATRTYLVSQLTSETIDAWIHTCEERKSKEVGFVNLNDNDQLVYRETSEEERSAHIDELRRIKKAVESLCTRVSSVAVAEMSPEKRSLYQKFMGLHNVEAIAVAKDHDAVLWSDDFIVGLIGKTDFDVPSIWTQLALRRNVESSVLSLEEFDLVTAKLASWKYVNIIWNPASIIAAGVQAGWEPQAWPLRQCLGLIETADIPVPVKVRIVLEFLQRLRRSDCIELKQSSVIRASLNALGDARAVRWILNHVDQAFGVDIPSAQFIRVELEYWLGVR